MQIYRDLSETTKILGGEYNPVTRFIGIDTLLCSFNCLSFVKCHQLIVLFLFLLFLVAPVISYSDIFNETHSEKELSTHLKPYVCRATGKPTPRVVWSDDHGAEFGAGNGSADLTINGAFTKEHGGNYFCTATNIAGEAKEKMFIQAVCMLYYLFYCFVVCFVT